MLIVSVAYNEDSFKFFQALEEKLSDSSVSLVSYCEDFNKEKKKAFMLKAGYGARKTPFAAITNEDKVPLKAFYSEVSECTVDNIIEYIDDFLAKNKIIENGNSSN